MYQLWPSKKRRGLLSQLLGTQDSRAEPILWRLFCYSCTSPKGTKLVNIQASVFAGFPDQRKANLLFVVGMCSYTYMSIIYVCTCVYIYMWMSL